MTAATGPGPRPAALRLAGLHLRTGAFRLARVELEELAGRDALDGPAILDLAEVRWRTGDLRGAAAAAVAWLRSDEGGVGSADAGPGAAGSGPAGSARARALAHAIAAEHAFVRGRDDDLAQHLAATLLALGAPAEAIPALARQLASSGQVAPGGQVAPTAGPPAIPQPAAGAPLPSDVETALDTLFAGIPPRSDAWPSFGPGGKGQALAAAADGSRDTSVAAFFEPEARAQLLAAADARRRSGQLPGAAEILALALRDEDASAADILAVTEAGLRDADRAGAAAWARLGLVLVRADALHVLGRHEEAAMAYASARRLALADPGPGPRSAGSAQSTTDSDRRHP